MIIIFFSAPHVNNNYSHQQPSTSNENIALTSQSYAPQHGHPPQLIENISFPFNLFNMTTISPSQSEIFSFDIPGFKIIAIPISSQQQDNNYLNYSSSDAQFCQFTQFQQ
ncbi:hypothetical protein RhiirA5_433430 [Rhizophagus irregularis]|uniref:Uncharacterized protein n=1 Tax=Rhizophagus irregularis TaxID=588596 RepID=A0A2N0NRU2_9GLOM|nr:hypothetical protein RhiirA5_433430 [Rhizophagus irregularis]CAB4477380.1 unnamed protein product [Rhizophagus irregularis]